MTFTNSRRTQIHFEPSAVQSILSLLSSTPLPLRPPLDSAPWSLGIDYDCLINFRSRWMEDWSCGALQGRVNEFEHFLVDYADEDEEDGEEKYEMTLHFVHRRSERADAITPLIIHGWPGTFYDFHKTLLPLTNPLHPSTSSRPPSPDSSSPPPFHWVQFHACFEDVRWAHGRVLVGA
ncbi:epoxide hydrolase N terminus-domain-containing protein [Irpex lacteus]|nr:epoxide hydrolase N terminus-domain-containing protein [Irpex lacteus]